MKKNVLLILVVAIFGFTSCKNDVVQIESEENSVIKESDSIVSLENEIQIDANSCYRYASSKDTIYLRMSRADAEVTGSLSYDYLEKPESKGAFKGEIIGDTIFAEYSYKAEGKNLIREIIFVKKDSSLVEGHGLTEISNGKTRFKPDAILSFNEVMSLTKVECE